MGIKLKIMLYVSMLLVFMAMFASAIVWGKLSVGIRSQMQMLEKDLRESGHMKIKAGSDTLKIFITNTEQSLINQTRFLTRNENVIRGVELGKFDNVRGVLQEFCSTKSMNFAVIYDGKGNYIHSYPYELDKVFVEDLFRELSLIKLLKDKYIRYDKVEDAYPVSEFTKWSRENVSKLSLSIDTDSTIVNISAAIIPNDYNDEAAGFIICGNTGFQYRDILKRYGKITGFISVAYSGETAIAADGFKDFSNNPLFLKSLNLSEKDIFFLYNQVSEQDKMCETRRFYDDLYNFFTFHVKDLKGNKVGLFITGERESIIKNAVNEVKKDGEKIFKQVFYSLLATLFILVVIGIALMNYFSSKITNSIFHAASIAEKIADGDLDQKMNITGKDELGILGRSMNVMIDSLRKLTRINEHQLYIAENKSKFDEVVRGIIDLPNLGESVARHFSEVFSALYVCVFTTKTVNDSTSDELYFAGGLGVDIEHCKSIVIKKGEGLAGSAIKTRKEVVISDVPLDYNSVTTINTKTKPRYLIILPVTYYGKVNGLIEMASFEKLSDKQHELLNTFTEPVAIAINTAQDHTRINELFEKSRELAEDLKVRQDELRNKAEELEKVSKYKSEFLANMSHEIRTPMNGVIGMVDILKDTELTSEQHEYVTSIAKSSDALLNVINDILDFSKIEAGKLDIEAIEFDIRSTVEDVAEMLSFRTNTKGLELICYISPEIPDYLIGDPGRLRQILFNIAGNSVKFTREGEILITVEIKEETDFEMTLLFNVKDTGIGISEDRIEKLFDSFSQADTSTTRKYGGTGLGLTIAKQLTELMGGTIGVESKPGIGSTFWFTSRFVKTRGERTPSLKQNMNLKGMRFLIVDDNPTNRNVFRAYLNSWQCQVEEAASGKIAISLLERHLEDGDGFDFAIIDMQMPDMNGESLGEKIIEDGRFSDIKLIMATSIGRKGDSKRLMDLGFSAYLNKPVKKNQLFKCIAGILSGPDSKDTENVKEHKFERLKSLNVLLVEDNKMNQKVAAKMLFKLNHNVTIANNGIEAIEIFRKKSFDLILMDGQMPEMDGYETAQYIRNEFKSDIPIIAVSAHAMKGDSEAFIKAGMDGYIPKPVKKKSLSEEINKVMKDKGFY